MTGAPMPDGADAVVMVERTQRDPDTDGHDGVIVTLAVEPGLHVRLAGGDLEAGEVVFEPGAVLTVAASGCSPRRRPACPGVPAPPGSACCRPATSWWNRARLAPGKIRDSNRPMLLAQLADAGVEAVDLGIARDDKALMTAALADAIDRCDAVITSGGVSVGDFDYVSDALERIAADDATSSSRVDWYQVAIKPALRFGVLRGTPVFGLPGNPVSSYVSFELFARPALRQMMGHEQPFRRQVAATAAEPMRRRVDGKLHFDRVVVEVVDGRYVATGVRSQECNAVGGECGGERPRAPPRRGGCRRRRRRHRHASGLTEERAPGGVPRAPSPSPPQERAALPTCGARRTGRSARLHGAAPGDVGLLACGNLRHEE